MVADAEARFVIALGEETVARAREAAGKSATVLALANVDDITDLSALADTQSPEPLAIDRPPDSLAQILYTSGTTGHPKGVTHSYASVAAAMGAWATAFAVGPDDRLLGQLALSHFGGRAMDTCWVAGATLVILLHSASFFVYLWATPLDQTGLTGFVAIVCFSACLLIGLIYAWSRGAADAMKESS